jgi:SAM-dependent methyltransferase
MGPTTDYDEIADRYAAGIDERPWNALYERPATLALLPDVAGLDVLDAGCGHGWYADWLVRHGARVVAIDRSARMVEHARGRLLNRATVLRSDMHQLPQFADGSFDLILSALAIHYVQDLTPTFHEWARLLRPGGMVVFSTHHPILHIERLSEPGYLVAELMEEEWGWLGSRMRYFRRPLCELTEPLTGAGFAIERIVEPRPAEAMKSVDPKSYNRLNRMPAFLHIRARR